MLLLWRAVPSFVSALVIKRGVHERLVPTLRVRRDRVEARGVRLVPEREPAASSLDLEMRLTPETPALRRWRVWVVALLVAEICWFALLRPRVFGHFRTLLVLGLLPLTVVGYVYLLAAASMYLSDRSWDFRLRQMIVVMLGLSVGCFVFALLWLAKVHFEGELGG
jgi:hypothetical protein